MPITGWTIADDRLGLPNIGNVYDANDYNVPLGLIVRAEHATYGAGEFVWCKGVASTIEGSAVVYDNKAGTTTLTVAAVKGPVAFATAAIVATKFGWYQHTGIAVAAVAAAVAAGADVYVTATAGKVDDAVVAGDQIVNANFQSADGTPIANQALVNIDRAYIV